MNNAEQVFDKLKEYQATMSKTANVGTYLRYSQYIPAAFLGVASPVFHGLGRTFGNKPRKNNE